MSVFENILILLVLEINLHKSKFKSFKVLKLISTFGYISL